MAKESILSNIAYAQFQWRSHTHASCAMSHPNPLSEKENITALRQMQGKIVKPAPRTENYPCMKNSVFRTHTRIKAKY